MTDRINRRRFVWLCLGAAATTSLVLTGCDGSEVTAEELPTGAPVPTTPATHAPTQARPTTPSKPAHTQPQQFVSACPRRLVNDPYPGRCRLYVDKKGDGICDLSQAI